MRWRNGTLTLTRPQATHKDNETGRFGQHGQHEPQCQPTRNIWPLLYCAPRNGQLMVTCLWPFSNTFPSGRAKPQPQWEPMAEQAHNVNNKAGIRTYFPCPVWESVITTRANVRKPSLTTNIHSFLRSWNSKLNSLAVPTCCAFSEGNKRRPACCCFFLSNWNLFV